MNKAIAQRKNKDMSRLHSNAAELLQRVARGDNSDRTRAMAGIYATQLDKRKNKTQ